MECACVYCDVSEGDDFVLKVETRKARKSHVCGECKREIVKGESYEYVMGKADGKIEGINTCPECLSIRHTFFCEGYYYGMVLEMLGEHIREMDGAVSSETMEKLTPKAKEKVIEMIGEEIDEED